LYNVLQQIKKTKIKTLQFGTVSSSESKLDVFNALAVAGLSESVPLLIILALLCGCDAALLISCVSEIHMLELSDKFDFSPLKNKRNQKPIRKKCTHKKFFDPNLNHLFGRLLFASLSISDMLEKLSFFRLFSWLAALERPTATALGDGLVPLAYAFSSCDSIFRRFSSTLEPPLLPALATLVLAAANFDLRGPLRSVSS